MKRLNEAIEVRNKKLEEWEKRQQGKANDEQHAKEVIKNMKLDKELI